MSIRFSRVAIALSFALPTVASAQGFEYATGTGRYRITQTTKYAQEAMGQKQEFESSNNQVMTVTLSRPTRDTLAMTVVVDSISFAGSMGPPPGADKLARLKVDARLSPSGAYFASSSTRDTSVDLSAPLAEAMGRFLPRIRVRLANGASWSDTTTGRTKQGGMEVDRKTFSRYRVAGDTTIAGERSWKVLKNDSTAMSGSGMAQGASMTMEGTAIGTGMLLLSQKGTYMGGEGDEVATLKIVLSGNGLEVTMTQSANTKVAKLN